jgi:hypothetical protein
MGAASAGQGILGAVGKYNSKQQQARTANKATVANYKNLLKQREFDWRNRLRVYGQQLSQYKDSEYFDKQALGRGYRGAQDVLTDEYRSMRFQQEQQNISRAQNLGSVLARGQTGASAARNVSNVMAAYGRNQAVMAQNILGARNRYAYDVEGLRRDYQSARNRAYSNVAIAPALGPAPVEPTLVQGPSQTGLFADIGSSILGGVTAGLGLAAKPVFPGGLPSQGNLNQNFWTGSGQPFSAGLGFDSGLGGSINFNPQGFGPLDPLKFKY